MADNIVLSNTEYKVVGTRPIRHAGHYKVTGRANYGARQRPIFYGSPRGPPRRLCRSDRAQRGCFGAGGAACGIGFEKPDAFSGQLVDLLLRRQSCLQLLDRLRRKRCRDGECAGQWDKEFHCPFSSMTKAIPSIQAASNFSRLNVRLP